MSRLVWLASVVALGVLCSCAGETVPASLADGCGGDRGIGGTGLTGEDRGIGGTGIVGTVTSVGRVCVNGIEVALDGTTKLEIDGKPGTPDALRVGQVVSIATAESGRGALLRALRLVVHHVVIGEVETAGGGVARIAGQAVAVPPDFAAFARPGAYVAVSGLRRPDAVIVASRLDAVQTGATRVTGLVERRNGTLWLGNARLSGPSDLPEGRMATLAGSYAAGELRVENAVVEPALPFGARFRRVVAEAFVSAEQGGLRLGQAPLVRPAPGLDVPLPMVVAQVELVIDPEGGMTAVRLRAEGRERSGGQPYQAPQAVSPAPAMAHPAAMPGPSGLAPAGLSGPGRGAADGLPAGMGSRGGDNRGVGGPRQ